MLDPTHSTLHPQLGILLVRPLHMGRHDGFGFILDLALALEEDALETELGESALKVRRRGDFE